jgi:hypothetical protein
MSNMKVFLISLIVFSFAFNASHGDNSDEVEKLTTQLLTNYRRSVKPNTLQKIQVDLKLESIQELDESSGSLTSSVYLLAKWSDDRLTWNQNQVNLSQILIEVNQIWFPSFWIMNDASNNGKTQVPLNLMTNLFSNGSVSAFFYLSPLTTKCKFEPFYYPYDTQNCSIKIRNLDNLNVTSSVINQQELLKLEHNIWNILNSKIEIYSEPIGVESVFSSSQDIKLSLLLKRRSFYFVLSHIFPLILLNILVLFMFAFPNNLRLGLGKHTFIN